ncbi:hypothetical protein SZ64_08405 [Erythrobacter sp. SG61-1L]|uniref:hypothetical protein n=1 Tax=Erythrobacter sp. SG61-1L TaxID=1603897 RepID=UPI0006C91F3A|nr:hypothetical protein [Erythrobacter sp. SG61-1L]KPL68139.1 hypothetical protein SZ64_08405 [Erythrobacter sp. SG61-1L]
MLCKPPLAILALVPALALAACGGKDDGTETPKGTADAEVASALGEEIMVDPDLAGQNQANSAVSAGLGDGALPPEMTSPEAIERARTDALKLLGGPGKLRKAPAAQAVAGKLPEGSALAVASRAAAAPGRNGNCADRAQYTMDWAARLPATFPVYPQGAVQEAAGTDEGACALRVINYVTAVPLDDVIDFYYTRATASGFTAQRVKEDGDDVLGGTKGKASFVLYARSRAKGGTEVDLVTNGE